MRIWQNDGKEEPNRGANIIIELTRLHNANKLSEAFQILDIAAGNANVLAEIKHAFPKCKAEAIDIVPFPEWDRHDFPCIPMALQEFIHKDNRQYEVVMMLNSYRNWTGPEKEEFDRWIYSHAKFFVTSFSGKFIGTDTNDFPMIMIDINHSK